MKKKKIKVYVEKSDEGIYWGTTQNWVGVVSSYGDSLMQLEDNLRKAVNDQWELAVELGEACAKDDISYSFDFQLDLQSFFHLISEVKISNLAKKAGINESLLRQYKSGLANASVEQTKKIEQAVHKLGEELLSVSF